MPRPLLNLLAAAAVILLGACTITSPTQLVAENEGVTPLPAKFAVYGYKKGEDGTYARTEEAPMSFAEADNAFVSTDNSMTMRLVALDNNGYLLSVSGNEPGALYGTAWIKGQIVVVRMLLADDADETLAKAKAVLPPKIASDLSSTKDGLSVTKRETLDELIALLRKGIVATEPLVAWITEDPDAPTPTRILKDTEGWKAE